MQQGDRVESQAERRPLLEVLTNDETQLCEIIHPSAPTIFASEEPARIRNEVKEERGGEGRGPTPTTLKWAMRAESQSPLRNEIPGRAGNTKEVERL